MKRIRKMDEGLIRLGAGFSVAQRKSIFDDSFPKLLLASLRAMGFSRDDVQPLVDSYFEELE